MKELSLHILDIAQNSVKAGATLIEITLDEAGGTLTLTVRDNGCGMDKALLERVTDPFTTTRTTRKVGLGIPLLKMLAEQCGGSFHIESAVGKGTSLRAGFQLGHIDFPPLGDMPSTMTTLIQGAPTPDYLYIHKNARGEEASLDTRVLREVLGPEVCLSEPEVLTFIGDSLRAEEEALVQ